VHFIAKATASPDAHDKTQKKFIHDDIIRLRKNAKMLNE